MPLAGSFRLLLDPEPSRYYQRRTLGYEGMIKYWDGQPFSSFDVRDVFGKYDHQIRGLIGEHTEKQTDISSTYQLLYVNK